ncbi:hypothetical protein HDU96_008301 [Phlyctochytrium bullatum]|nr:hypothetical protein HDU96_008301 [Phlyctochytrium bullatum]
MSPAAIAAASVVVAAAVGIAALYVAVVPSRTRMMGSLADAKGVDPELRKAYPEDYWKPSLKAELSKGMGPETGPKLVLVHGMMACWAALPKFVELLAARGFRILLYDTYGRGYSSAPGARYDRTLYATQLKDLLDHVGWDSASIVGYSLGGAIATAFASEWPDRVENLVLLAPAGLPETLPPVGRLASVPIIGEIVVHLIGRKLMIRQAGTKVTPEAMESNPYLVSQLVVLHHPGYMRCIHSTVVHGPIRGMDDCYAANGARFGDRILCVWGTADKVVNFETDMPKFRKYNPEAKIVELEGLDHDIVPLHPEIVEEHVAKFLEERGVWA